MSTRAEISKECRLKGIVEECGINDLVKGGKRYEMVREGRIKAGRTLQM
jgi:hypothetical protein